MYQNINTVESQLPLIISERKYQGKACTQTETQIQTQNMCQIKPYQKHNSNSKTTTLRKNKTYNHNRAFSIQVSNPSKDLVAAESSSWSATPSQQFVFCFCLHVPNVIQLDLQINMLQTFSFQSILSVNQFLQLIPTT